MCGKKLDLSGNFQFEWNYILTDESEPNASTVNDENAQIQGSIEDGVNGDEPLIDETTNDNENDNDVHDSLENIKSEFGPLYEVHASNSDSKTSQMVKLLYQTTEAFIDFSRLCV